MTLAADAAGFPSVSGRWLARLGGGRLAWRIVALSLGLLLLVQIAGFAVVRSSIERNVRSHTEAELDVGARVWQRLLDTHAQRLHAAAEVLVSEYGFRKAYGERHIETIASALENHGARIGATIAATLDTAYRPQAVHAEPRHGTLPAGLLHQVASALAVERGGSGLVQLGDEVLLFVAVPIRLPLTVGWVLMGIPLGQDVVDDMRALSGIDTAVVAAPSNGPPRIAIATPAARQVFEAAGGFGRARRDDMALGDDRWLTHEVTLAAVGGGVQAVLLRSTSDAAEPLRQLQWVLAAITAAGVGLFALGSVWTARRVTAPLRALVDASGELGQGRYAQPVGGRARRDEIGDLARAFDHMRVNLAQHEAELRHLAYADRLTQLPNRAGFAEAAQAAIASAGRGSRMAVLMLDLDRFKHVNDVLGYAQGDRLLQGVARRLTDEVARAGDVVARLGGDEFALLLPATDADAAQAVARRLVASFERPLQLDDQTVDLSAGVGIAHWPSDAADAETLLVRAEIAMYGAKQGHDVIRRYDPSQDSGSTQTLSLLSELRHAIEAGELRLFLQPKVALADRRLVGAEALVRWQHPQRGLVPPLDFIPFAEQTGFVRQLTLWVFEEAARQWQALAGEMALRISVNLSTRDLMDSELPQRFDTLLRRHGVPESAFCLEITESAIMDDPQRSLATLEALSARGFKLSIDDFGTGYSSLAYLRRLPVDELKIDRSFVQGMQHNADDAKIVRSTIDLAHNLGLSVVAEGIEDARDAEMLADLGCDEGQGYHMSRPLPLAQFRDWARQWSAQPAPAGAPA